MQLIPEVKQAWRMFSVQLSSLGAALMFAWGVLPQDLKDRLPTDAIPWLAMGIFLLTVVGRIVYQPSLDEPKL